MRASLAAVLLLLTPLAPPAAAQDPADPLVPTDEVAAPDEEELAVGRDLELLAELGDRCPPHVLRRLANSDDERVAPALAAVFADESLAWRTRALALTAWARHVRVDEELEGEERDAAAAAVLAAARTWSASDSPLLRAGALEAVDELGADGEATLKEVAESAADTIDRVRAFELFAEDRERPDYGWFKEVFLRGGAKAPQEEREAYAADGALGRMREIAFAELADEMRAEEVEEALRDRSLFVRVRAHEVERERDTDDVHERSEKLVEDDDEPVELRRFAADTVAEHVDRQRYYTILFELGAERRADPELRRSIAARISRNMPQRVLDIVRKQLTSGKEPQRLFAIDALPLEVMRGRRERAGGLGGPDPRDEPADEEDGFTDEKVLEALRSNLRDRDQAVRLESLRALVERADRGALDEVVRAARKAKTDLDRAATLRARAALGDEEKDLLADLALLAASTSLHERRAAVAVATLLDPDGYEDLLRAALLEGPPVMARAVVDGVLERRWGRGVTLLLEALELDDLAVRDAALRALWRLTGRDDGPRAADWQEWWSTERGAFRAVEPEVARELTDGWGAPLRRERVLGELFGVEFTRPGLAVALHLGPPALEVPASRRATAGADAAASFVELVRRDLVDLVRHAGPVLSVRVFASEDGADGPWPAPAPCAPERADELEGWFGAYAPLRTASLEELLLAAEADPSVDELVLVTDGDGRDLDLEEAEAVRRAFALRNRERDLVVHGVALGRDSRALRWLAETAGGRYVLVP